MKDSEIARKAAELVDERGEHASWSCFALADAGGFCYFETMPLAREYCELFNPNEGHGMSVSLNIELQYIGIKNWRILALLFFAEILESEGR